MAEALIRRLGIVGPGLMGLGIAQLAAAAGINVVLVGRDAASAVAGRQRLAALFERQVARGRLRSDAATELLSAVEAGRDFSALSDCDLAIESVAENRMLKIEVLNRMQAALPPGTLIASNTSGLPISGLASALLRPERFIGLHFFSPVERMPLVEVVRGQQTAEATVCEALAFVEQLGQRPIVVRDGPGFFTSRVFAAYLDEALAMVGEGVAPALVEQAARDNGRAIGPLAVLDDISLQLNWQQVRQARADGLEDRFCRPLAWPVLDKMLALGRHGRRQGGGFYETGANGERQLWTGLTEVFPPCTPQPSLATVQRRLRCAEALEALRCLEEGVIATADDADTGSLLGLGFPASRGGVLSDVETVGLGLFVADCDALARQYGRRYAPSDWLRACAANPQGLAAWRSFSNLLE
ncbi:MAG: 3-hydroxyacyl-CoA dehydrogenase NAD-binding domain-containing protein [Burkholderiaceae bacterium]|nr:3-hydroxyacyl-CoA dehydrogenase NAD-binding domain-containing protein [Burkholderiaceae bacterium]